MRTKITRAELVVSADRVAALTLVSGDLRAAGRVVGDLVLTPAADGVDGIEVRFADLLPPDPKP